MARRVPRVAVLSLSLLLLALALARAPIGSTAGRVLREEETHRKDDDDGDTFFTLSRVERLKRRESIVGIVIAGRRRNSRRFATRTVTFRYFRPRKEKKKKINGRDDAKGVKDGRRSGWKEFD